MHLVICADARDMTPWLRCRMLVAKFIRSQRYPIDWNRYGMERLGLGEHEAVVLYILVRAKPTVSEERDASIEIPYPLGDLEANTTKPRYIREAAIPIVMKEGTWNICYVLQVYVRNQGLPAAHTTDVRRYTHLIIRTQLSSMID